MVCVFKIGVLCMYTKYCISGTALIVVMNTEIWYS